MINYTGTEGDCFLEEYILWENIAKPPLTVKIIHEIVSSPWSRLATDGWSSLFL